jgi:hypothetical protein
MYAFYRAMSRHDCRPIELTLFERVVEDLEAFVNEQDVFWVGGGSTANLLAVWRLPGLDSLLRTAYERGAVLCGVSAGMNCWFEGSTTDSFGPTLRSLSDASVFSPARPVRTTTRTWSAGRSFAGLWTRERCLPDGQPTTLRRCTFGTASSSRPSPGATRLGVTASSPALRSHCQLGSSDDASSQPSRLERTRQVSQEDRSVTHQRRPCRT